MCRLILALLVLVGLVACGPKPVDPLGDPHAGHEHAAHLHEAPRGGLLIVLREEGAHVELLADPATGHVSLLVLGPHGAQPVRIAQPSITILLDRAGLLDVVGSLDVAGAAHTIELPAVASELTGETMGDSSEFAAVVPVLKGAGTFAGSIASVTVRGETYTDLAFTYP